MNLNDKTASFGLIRTNPKISGNVKITVDSVGKIWLNSIDANKNLSISKYKKFPVPATSNYEVNLQSFIGDLPPKLFFDALANTDPLHTHNTFQKQYDFFYGMGATPLISNLYDEDYSYFAPLWMRDQLPDYFVIVRVDDPLDFPYNKGVGINEIIISTPTPYKVVGTGFSVKYESVLYSDGDIFTSNTDTFYAITAGSGKVVNLNENKDLPIDFGAQFESIMKKAQIITTFDLTETSDIGRYLRNIQNNPQRPASPITVKFDAGLLTTWNGPSYIDGVIASKGEYLDTFWSSANTQIDFEEYVTQGFERHGIVSSNLLNLEFLFNDDSATLYSIPRYLGFYVSKTEMGTFQLDGQKLFDKRFVSGNTPQPKRPNKGFRYQDDTFFQNNPDGVRLFYTNPTGTLPNSSLFDPSVFEPRMYWVQDRENNFYSLNAMPENFINGDYNLTDTDFVLRNKTVDLGAFGGGDTVKLQGKGAYLDDAGRSYMVMKVLDQLFPNDKIRIYWNIGSQTDIDGKYDEITGNDLSQRPFTVPANGTVLTYSGDLTGSLTVASEFHLGDTIFIHYGNNNVVPRTITSTPTYNIFPNTTTFSINAPIDLTSTSGYTPIVPGWGPGSYMAAESFNPIYFHPYGTTSDVAKAIAGAFNTLEARTFDAIAINDEVVLRMRAPGSDTNKFFSKAYLTLPARLTLQGQTLTGNPSQKVSFEGGTKHAHTRMRFTIDETDILKNGESWVRSKLGLGKIIHVGRYVDAAVKETGGSDISDLSGFNQYGVFAIENELDTPLIGSTKEFVIQNLFNIKTGVFSFFSVKDIDGDFLSSTYERSPVQEYHRYFDLLPNEDVLVEGRNYIVMGDGATDSILYNSVFYSPPLSQPPNGTIFTAVAGQPRFTIASGNPFVVPQIFYNRRVTPDDILQTSHTYLVLGDAGDFVTFLSTPYSVGSTFNGDNQSGYVLNIGSSAIVIDTTNFVIDEDLKSFPGFQKLKDFLSIQEEQLDKTQLQFTNRDKFFHSDISSEYDYLKENFTKNDATKSRLVPVVSKWVYSGGSDIRDNPYRLNVLPVFGTHNFSPNFFVKLQKPDSFTHEWYYLEGAPQQYPSQFIKDNYYFFTDKIDLAQLKDANPASLPDYFEEYFTFQPTPTSPDQERYSLLEFNKEIGLSETLFRGVKVRAKEIIRDSRLPQLQGIKPPFKQGSTRFDGYKFSCLLRVKKETRSLIESPVQIHLVENKTAKAITMFVDVILEDYRTLTLTDPGNLGSFASPFVPYPDTLDTSTDYLLLYSMRSKKTEAVFNDSSNIPLIKGMDANRIADIKLSVGLNLSSPSALLGPNTVVNVYDNPDYDWDLRDEIKNFKKENSFHGTFRFGDTSFPYPLAVTQKQILFGIPTNSYPQDVLPYPFFQAPATPVPTNINIPYGSSFEWEDPTFATYQFDGGNLYYEPIMQRISFARIAEKINNYSPFVKYKSYTWDENTLSTTETENEFYIELVEPSIITKTQSLIPQLDEDKPQEFKKEAVIGVTLQTVNSAEIMLRYSGPYEPKFKNILFFKGQKTDQIVISESPLDTFDLSFQQATFNPSVEGFGLIQNLYYLKIANGDILSLVNNTKYPSLYPLINEIAIDKRDFPIFESSWDPGFWRIYTTKSQFHPQAGTREMLEIKNFFGSKIMKTQKSLGLQTFTVAQVDDVDVVDTNNIPAEVVFSVAGNKIKGLVDIGSRALRFWEEDGADAEFVKNLMPEFGTGDPDTLNDDVNEYLTLNVLPEYEVKVANMYVRRYKENLGLPIVRGDLTDANKIISGYRVEPNFVTKKITDRIYGFEFTIDPSTNVSIAPSFTIGKI